MEDNSLWGAHATLAELIIARGDEKSNNRIVYTKAGPHEVDTPCRSWNSAAALAKKRPLCCWHDTYELERGRMPVFLPVSHDDARKYFWVFGRFCSFACAVKFAFEHQYIRGQYTLMLLKLMAMQVYGMSSDEVNAPEGPFVPAPCRESLNIFGNNGLSRIDIEIFRDMVLARKPLPDGIVRQTSSLRLPPFISTDNVNYDVYSKQRIANYEAVYLYKSFSDKMPHVIVANMVRQQPGGGGGPLEGSVCWQDTEPLPEGVLPMGIPIAVTAAAASATSEPAAAGAVAVFQVFGAFCSANCMLAYLNDKLSWNTDELRVLVHRMCWEVFQVPSSLIVEQAPPAWDLRKFGGTLTIDEYRAAVSQVRVYAHDDPCWKTSVQWVTMSIEYQSNVLPPNHASLRTIGVMMASTMMDTVKDISLDSSVFTKFMDIDQGDKSIITDAAREALHSKIFARSKKKPKKSGAAAPGAALGASGDDKVEQNAHDAK